MKYVWYMVIAVALVALAIGCTPETGSSNIIPGAGNGVSTNCPGGMIVDGRCVTPPGAENATNATENRGDGIFAENPDPFVVTEAVDEDAFSGFLVKPNEPGEYPGVVVVHEWWGLNENIQQMAKILAREGYVVLAVDLYDGQVATDQNRSRELVQAVQANQSIATAKMRAAVDYLREEENVSNVAALGWCFGGGQALLLSLEEPVNATVIYYGNLVNDTNRLRQLAGPVLGIFGANDTSIPVSSVLAFRRALDQLGKDNEIVIYPDVGHAFANPTGDNYARQETVDAWNKTLAFLSKNLKGVVIVTNGTATNQTQNATSNASGAAGNDTDVELQIQAENFNFLIDGTENADIIVNEGDVVRVELESIEGLHDFVVDELDVRTDRVRDGGSTSVEFVADRVGTFEYYCSVGTHRQMGMRGNIIVR